MDEVRELPAGKEIDLAKAIWHLPSERTKNGRANDVPLSDAALAVLKSIPPIEGAEFVFTTTGTTPFSGVSKAKDRLDREMLKKLQAEDTKATLSHFTLHDLRRTVATGLQRLGYSIEVVEAVLNHRSGSLKGVAGVYARHDFADEKRAALEAWADHVAHLLNPKAAKVLKFPRKS
jgi:integrase